MVNLQPVEHLVRTDGKLLDVHSIWYTLQGEGPFSGCPAVFVRLAGCNLQCSGCDTNYTDGRGGMVVGDVLLNVLLAARNGESVGPKVTKLVVLTGGEPFRQPVGPLTRALLGEGFEVQVETNGTVWLEDFPWGAALVTVVCSPKTHVNGRLKPHVDHLKYVLCHKEVDGKTGLPTLALNTYRPELPWPGFPRERVWVSPMDAGPGKDVENALNRQACVRSALAHGYRVSLQQHKYLGVP